MNKDEQYYDIKDGSTRKWRAGNWFHNSAIDVLKLFGVKDTVFYEVDLEDCRKGSAQCLDWIFQVVNKTWATPQIIFDLIISINVLVKPQQTLCSFGKEKKNIGE